MAEVTTHSDSRRKPVRIDMTPMVDLAFLLVTFFMLTTTLSKPKIMKLTMPEQHPKPMTTSDEVTTTLVLDKDNQLFYYRGVDNPEVFTTSYAPDGLRKMALEMVRKGVELKKDAVFIIKPTKASSYQNVVDVLDEMKITNVSVYAIQSLHPQEESLIEAYKQAHSIQ